MDEQDRGFRLGGIAGALVPQEQLHVALVGPVLGAGQALCHFMHERAFQGAIAMSRIRHKANESRWVKGSYASVTATDIHSFFLKPTHKWLRRAIVSSRANRPQANSQPNAVILAHGAEVWAMLRRRIYGSQIAVAGARKSAAGWPVHEAGPSLQRRVSALILTGARR